MALPPPSPQWLKRSRRRLTTRRFTGHENIDGLGVIHMNGRIYDPDLGRFLQPDPVIQAPNSAQSWNAYTYVFNNPLRYTDPTGMIGIEERQWAGAAVAIVMTAIYPGSAQLWYSMLTGMVAGWVSTGSMQGAITGAISAGLFAGIGSYFDSARWANAPSGSGAFGSGLTWGGYGAKTLSHGVAGGVMSTMQGGKFGHGFASAGVAQAFSPMINNIGNNAPSYAPARIAAAIILGGTASLLSGGKFASGAVTAAFSRAFNDETHPEGGTWTGADRALAELKRIAETVTSPELSDFRDASVRFCGGVKAAGCIRVGFEGGKPAFDAVGGAGVATGLQLEMQTDWGGVPEGAAGGPRGWVGVEFSASATVLGVGTGYRATGLMTTQGALVDEGVIPLRWKPGSVVSRIGSVIAGGRVGGVFPYQAIDVTEQP
ncbi:RHS repeat-associated core domain-containing protein [Montanilutibacter psychrotolerans]|uniref:RHS repeat-associated core domain-containing protein n=1 Tax=Montanilutibacter psychrotolerans TaxID=1327343 RepID=A0A3M8T1C3_9GAMM|nr:RHS repeat-associated core domain-containing protein [Lysobacter psychrotolerans]RNF85294.1 hypothetical protein EER27_05895 [Lysobacter psychrotolerans]